ncbi:hypothetical protein BH10PLA2_BH10PLA2_09690 [soil metagenome]
MCESRLNRQKRAKRRKKLEARLAAVQVAKSEDTKGATGKVDAKS